MTMTIELRRRGAPAPAARAGFTLVELLIVAVVGGVIIMAAFGLFLTQATMVTTQREVLDVRETLRSASTMLLTDLRDIAADDGDLYALSPDSIMIRTTTGSGVVCSDGWDGAERRLAFQHVNGNVNASTSDSILAYQPSQEDWSAFDVSEAWTGGQVWLPSPGANMPVCFWGDSTTAYPRPQVAVDLTGDSTALAGVIVGSPIRSFRRTVYGLFEREGDWWLGRREGAATTWEVLAGPTAPPADSGFVVTYYEDWEDESQPEETTDPDDVEYVRVHLRGWSAGTLSDGSRSFDSVTVSVALRNN